MSKASDAASDMGQKAQDKGWFKHAIRAGLIAYGVVHLLIGWLALQLALGDREESASSSGAMKQLAEQPFGVVLLWLVGLGLFILVVWRIVEAIYGHEDEDGGKLWAKRAVDLGKAVIYATIGFSAVRTATGSGSSGGTDSTTKKVMDLPGGQWLVLLIGLGVIGYGAHHVYQAWSENFREKLSGEGESGSVGSAYVGFGKAGYTAKGVAVGVVGGLFVYAGATHKAKESGGLDQALQTVLQQPFGSWLLALIAVGFVCFGLFSFARARHLPS